MRKLPLLLLALFVSAAWPTCGHAQGFARAMQKVFAGSQFRGYQWLDYPVDGFGVATAYEGKVNRIDDRKFLCATFSTLRISPEPIDPAARMKLAISKDSEGYADMGRGGALATQLASNNKTMLSVFLPELFRVIGVNAEYARQRGIATSLSFTAGVNRKLKSRKTLNLIGAMDDDPYGVREAYRSGNLVLVVADVVIESLDIAVTANAQLKNDLNVKMEGQASHLFTSGSSIAVEVINGGDNSFHLKLASPVIVGILAAHQPPPGVVARGNGPGGLKEWKGWTACKVRIPATAKHPR